MDIKTKFNANELAYFVAYNQVHRSKIQRIVIAVHAPTQAFITYYFTVDGVPTDIPEDRCFATKEELLNSL